MADRAGHDFLQTEIFISYHGGYGKAAAKTAASDAAWYAAKAVASSAAWDAAKDVTWNAPEAEAAQNEQLKQMVREARTGKIEWIFDVQERSRDHENNLGG
jgi:hypothetical protein